MFINVEPRLSIAAMIEPHSIEVMRSLWNLVSCSIDAAAECFNPKLTWLKNIYLLPIYISLITNNFYKTLRLFFITLGEYIKHLLSLNHEISPHFIIFQTIEKPSATKVLGCSEQGLFMNVIPVKEGQKFLSHCSERKRVVLLGLQAESRITKILEVD